MRVTINSLAMPSARQGGAGFYAATLIDGLSRRPELEATALVSPTVATELTELAPEARVLAATPRPRGRASKALNYLAAGRRPWTLDLGFEARFGEADIVHWPISFMNAPEPAGARRVVTVHDLQHEVFPQFFSRRDLLLRRLRWRPSAVAADRVVTISCFSRDSLCERYGIPAERIAVVPLGARLTLSAEPVLPAALKGVERWLFYPASPLPAKNHERLLAALARSDDKEAKLVLTGPTMHSWSGVHESIAAHGLQERVLCLGHVGEAELAGLYAGAAGLIFPSLFEGFGLPALEAMAAGCPVAVADSASLPEVVGEAGAEFDPLDVDAIAGAIGWLLELSGSQRERVVAAGRARAGEYSVERMVEGTVEAYREVLA